jgi:hypothetical protein
MDTREERRQRFQHEQQTKKRLRLATMRLHEAEQERIWAIVAAHDAGLSIRQIATATGLSRSRIHQLLQDLETREIPAWLTHLRARDHTSAGEVNTKPSSQSAVQARVAEEVEVLRWCIDWLMRWERGEMVVVNLRPDTEDATEFVWFDQARVHRVLARIAADLDVLARHDPTTELECPAESMEPRTQHRRRLAEPEEEPTRGRTAKAQRDALRKAFGLPPDSGDYSEYFRHIRGANT